MMVRVHGRVDVNQTEIVAALRKVGASVQSLADLGKGVPDLLVGFHGHEYLLEVKSGDAVLTPLEEAWHRGWNGRVRIVRSVREALLALGVRT